MRKNLLPLLLPACTVAWPAAHIQAQQLEWAKSFGETGVVITRDLQKDQAGDLYVGGYFTQTVDFDPGAGTVNLSSPSGYTNVYLQKLTDNGDLIWVKQIQGTENAFLHDIAFDKEENIYITGSFSGTHDFDPGSGTFMVTASDADNVFVLKLDHNANFIWVKTLNVLGYPYQTLIDCDSSGNVYIGGQFEGTVDLDPGTGTNLLTTYGLEDAFVLKLDSLGDFQWMEQIGSTNTNGVSEIQVGDDGYLYVTGGYYNNTSFVTGTDSLGLVMHGSYDGYMQKSDIDGHLVWVKGIGGTNFDNAKQVEVDSLGNVYVIGSFRGTVDLDPGPGIQNFTAMSPTSPDIYMLKLNPSGDYSWAKQFTGDDQHYPFRLSRDNEGNLYVAGNFTGEFDCDPSFGGVYNLLSVESNDIFVLKVDSSGNFLWGGQVAGLLQQMGVSLYVDEKVYLSGTFSGDTDVDPGPANYDLLNMGGENMSFVCKWNQSLLGLAENNETLHLQVYPNPTSGQVFIALEQPGASVRITNAQGQLMGQEMMNGNHAHITINGPAGLYFVSVTSGNQQAVIRLVKE